MQTETKKMKPSAELLELAREKAFVLWENQQIRLGGGEYEESYTILRDKDNRLFICWEPTSTLVKFFKNRTVYELVSNKTGQLLFKCQRLESKSDIVKP